MGRSRRMAERRPMRRPVRQYQYTAGGGGTPAPSTSSISPTSCEQWDSAFTLTVNGANFVSGDTIYVGATALVTTFVGSTQLTGAVPQAASPTGILATAGTPNVTVVGVNGTSNAQTLTITSWTVASVSGLQAWYRADSGDITQSGGFVSQWNDKSGNGRHLVQGTGANQPAYTSSAAAFGNQPVVDFDGSAHFMTNATTFASLISLSADLMGAVFSVDAIDTDNAPGVTYNNDAIAGDTGGNRGIHLRQTGPAAHSYGWDGAARTAVETISTGTPIILQCRHGGGNMLIRAALGSETSVACGNIPTLTGTLRVGRNYTTAYFDGQLAELMIFNVSPSLADRDHIVRYQKGYFSL